MSDNSMTLFLLICLHFFLLFCILIALIVIAGRSPPQPRGLFVRTCPYCRELMWSRATVVGPAWPRAPDALGRGLINTKPQPN